MRRLHLAVLVPGLALLAACPSEQTDTTTTVVDLTQTETGDGDPGDGDPGDGDGDPGDGDPGDGDPGDGDGDPGDGDGDPCPVGTLGCACDEDDQCLDELNCNEGVCASPTCGDGVLDPGEECDVGNETMFCDEDCTYSVCGDGYWNQLSEQCDDGNNIDDDFCSNSCVSNGGVFYTGDFTQGQASQQQCADWQTFQAQLQQAGNFSFIQISGTNNQQGVSCNGAAANTICQAIANSQTVANIACDGRTWNVGPCGNGTELNAQGNGDCVCDNNPSYTLRPCINNLNWGGVNTLTCNAPSQTMEVICG